MPVARAGSLERARACDDEGAQIFGALGADDRRRRARRPWSSARERTLATMDANGIDRARGDRSRRSRRKEEERVGWKIVGARETLNAREDDDDETANEEARRRRASR